MLWKKHRKIGNHSSVGRKVFADKNDVDVGFRDDVDVGFHDDVDDVDDDEENQLLLCRGPLPPLHRVSSSPPLPPNAHPPEIPNMQKLNFRAVCASMVHNITALNYMKDNNNNDNNDNNNNNDEKRRTSIPSIFAYEMFVETHPTLRCLMKKVMPRLAKLGVYMFIIPNSTGWLDMPTDMVQDIDGRILTEERPYLIGDMNTTSISFSHDIINNSFLGKNIRKQVLRILKTYLRKKFSWDGSPNSTFQVSLAL